LHLLTPTPDYNVFYKVVDFNNPGGKATAESFIKTAEKENAKEEAGKTRRAMARGRSLLPAQVRRLVAGEDPGISWDALLRFDGISFPAGGEYKLCFCDPSLLASGICSVAEDYRIEVGRVHATGLECLLTNPRMQRGTCVQQMYGGLRCYDGAAPETPVPPEFFAVPDTKRAKLSTTAQLLLEFCQFAPEQDAAQFPFCAQHRQFVVPVVGLPDATP
jgi:hypothetical protein